MIGCGRAVLFQSLKCCTNVSASPAHRWNHHHYHHCECNFDHHHMHLYDQDHLQDVSKANLIWAGLSPVLVAMSRSAWVQKHLNIIQNVQWTLFMFQSSMFEHHINVKNCLIAKNHSLWLAMGLREYLSFEFSCHPMKKVNC